MTNEQKTAAAKIEKLKKQLTRVVAQIEKERFESNEDDTVILQELLDKKDMIEQQIAELQDTLVIGNDADNLEKTYFLDINGGKKTLTVVSSSDVDPSKGHISHKSPLAKALMGKKKGDHITIETPAGTQTIIIKHIE